MTSLLLRIASVSSNRKPARKLGPLLRIAQRMTAVTARSLCILLFIEFLILDYDRALQDWSAHSSSNKDVSGLQVVSITVSHVYITGTIIHICRRTYGRIYYTISILPFLLFLFFLTTEVFYVYFHTQNVFNTSGMVARSNSSCSSFLQFNRTNLLENGYTDANLAKTNFFSNTLIRDNFTRIFNEDNLRCLCHPVLLLVNNNNNNNNNNNTLLLFVCRISWQRKNTLWSFLCIYSLSSVC